jgi:diguanylate cyclase (GGDEF)-like protein
MLAKHFMAVLGMRGFPTFSSPELEETWRLSCTGRMSTARERVRLLSRRAGRGARERGEIAWQSALFSLATGTYGAAVRYGAVASAYFEAPGLEQWRALAQAVTIWAATILGDRRCLDDAFTALAAIEPDSPAASWLANTIAIASWSNGQQDAALEWAERAVAQASRIDEVTVGRWLNTMGLPLMAQALAADPLTAAAARDRAIATFEQSASLCERHSDLWTLRIVLCNLVEFYLDIGRPADAEAALARLDRHAATSPEPLSPRERLHVAGPRGVVLAARGDRAGAIACLEDGVALAAGLRDLECATVYSEKLAHLHAETGDYRGAYEAHRRFHAFWLQRADHAARSSARVAAVRFKATGLASRAAALEVANARLAAESHRDPLTGLRNRRGLDDALNEALAGGRITSIAMVDIDHFKGINDAHSHQVGDEVLIRVASLLGRAAPAGLAFRIGGEEFLLILPGIGPDDAVATCECLRDLVRLDDWTRLSPRLVVTVSIGLAYSTEADRTDALMARADARLYAAKRNGRNCTEGGLQSARNAAATIDLLRGSIPLGTAPPHAQTI